MFATGAPCFGLLVVECQQQSVQKAPSLRRKKWAQGRGVGADAGPTLRRCLQYPSSCLSCLGLASPWQTSTY